MINTSVTDEVKHRVYAIADELDWTHLTINQRSQYYTAWTDDPEIGGRLAQVMERVRVRVYIKDTIMKSYSRDQRSDILSLLPNMSITYRIVTRTYVKPQAVLCDASRLYTLSIAKEWKTSIMSAYERAAEVQLLEDNLVCFTEHTIGRFVDKSFRDMIATAAKNLGVRIMWLT